MEKYWTLPDFEYIKRRKEKGRRQGKVRGKGGEREREGEGEGEGNSMKP